MIPTSARSLSSSLRCLSWPGSPFSARRGARFVLLLENLHEQPGVRLFINRDMAAGTTPEISGRCIETFAALHAAFWGMPAPERERLLPSRLHTHLAPGGRARTPRGGARR